jgi:hypothetical protein
VFFRNGLLHSLCFRNYVPDASKGKWQHSHDAKVLAGMMKLAAEEGMIVAGF